MLNNINLLKNNNMSDLPKSPYNPLIKSYQTQNPLNLNTQNPILKLSFLKPLAYKCLFILISVMLTSKLPYQN